MAAATTTAATGAGTTATAAGFNGGVEAKLELRVAKRRVRILRGQLAEATITCPLKSIMVQHADIGENGDRGQGGDQGSGEQFGAHALPAAVGSDHKGVDLHSAVWIPLQIGKSNRLIILKRQRDDGGRIV
jgi:hypothetical protein